MSGGSAYLWMAARARNALRRVLVFGIVGGVVFISALIAFVIVPRSASRKALAVAQNIEAPTDSAPTIAARDRYAAQINVADSILNATRRALVPAASGGVLRCPPMRDVARHTFTLRSAVSVLLCAPSVLWATS
jgi:hypothetical protein